MNNHDGKLWNRFKLNFNSKNMHYVAAGEILCPIWLTGQLLMAVASHFLGCQAKDIP